MPSASPSPNGQLADHQPFAISNAPKRVRHQGSAKRRIGYHRQRADAASFDHLPFTALRRSTPVSRTLTPLSTSRPRGGFVRGHR
jgi:hypothetical protein